MTRRTFLANIRAYKSSISEIHYGELLIKKPGEEKYTFINMHQGVIQAGEGFSLTKKEARRLWIYYLGLYYSETFELLYIPYVPNPEGAEPRRLNCLERQQRSFKFGKWMNFSPKFNGSYKTMSRSDRADDGYNDLHIYYIPEKGLQRRARKVGIFLIRYPHYVLKNKDLEDSYLMFDLKSGTFVGGEGYHFIDKVLEHITFLETQKANAKATKSKEAKAKADTSK